MMRFCEKPFMKGRENPWKSCQCYAVTLTIYKFTVALAQLIFLGGKKVEKPPRTGQHNPFMHTQEIMRAYGLNASEEAICWEHSYETLAISI